MHTIRKWRPSYAKASQGGGEGFMFKLKCRFKYTLAPLPRRVGYSSN